MKGKRQLIVLGVLAVVLLPGAPAWAHNELAAAEPAANAALGAAPAKVSLRFLQRLNPDFTTIVVSDGAQRRVPVSEPVIDGAIGAVTFTGPLANGGYTVAYRVVSVDGHAVQGSYKFSVDDPAAASAPVAGPASAPQPEPIPAPLPERIPKPVLITVVGVGVVLAGIAAFRLLKGRSRRPGSGR